VNKYEARKRIEKSDRKRRAQNRGPPQSRPPAEEGGKPKLVGFALEEGRLGKDWVLVSHLYISTQKKTESKEKKKKEKEEERKGRQR